MGGKVMLEWISENQDGEVWDWIRLIKGRNSGGLLWTSGFHKNGLVS